MSQHTATQTLQWRQMRIWSKSPVPRLFVQQGPVSLTIFLPAIQIRWKAIRSQQIFPHATTAQLPCHVLNFVAIAVLESRWVRVKRNFQQIWIAMEKSLVKRVSACPAKNKRKKKENIKRSMASWQNCQSVSQRLIKTCRIYNNLVLPVRMTESI